MIYTAANATNLTLSASGEVLALTPTAPPLGTYLVMGRVSISTTADPPGNLELQYSTDGSAWTGLDYVGTNNILNDSLLWLHGVMDWRSGAGSLRFRMYWNYETSSATFGRSNDARWQRWMQAIRLP